MLIMLALSLFACTGGPFNNSTDDTGEVIDTTEIVVGEFGAIIPGVETHNVNLSVWIGADPTSCQVNITVTDCGWGFSETVSLSNKSNVDFEISDGLCLSVSAGDLKYTTTYDSPTPVEEGVMFRSNWSEDFGPVVKDVNYQIELDWNLRFEDKDENAIEYYCWIDAGYWWNEDMWELYIEDDQLNGGPFIFQTGEDGKLEGDFMTFGPDDVYIVGREMISQGDISLYDTWQAADGSFGVTVESSSMKSLRRCEIRQPL